MTRFQPSDFGYDFATSEEKETLVAAEVGVREASSGTQYNSSSPPPAAAETGEYELYRESSTSDFKYQLPKRRRRGEPYVVTSNDAKSAVGTGAACLGALCCCLTVCLVIAGGVLLSVESSQNTLMLVGSILLVLAAAACLCACSVVCLGAVAESLMGDGETDNADPHNKEVKVRFRRLNDRYEKASLKSQDALSNVRVDVLATTNTKELKEAAKKEQNDRKEKEKQKREELENQVKQDLQAGMLIRDIKQKYRPVAFFINFEGDMMVSSLELLRKQVSLVCSLGKKGQDICIVVVTSPGGSVAHYGLAASQLVRIRKAGIKLIVCVDSIAASGGYLMASTADTICAAPFAIVGSIGVVTQIPNFQRFLEDKKIDAYLVTAGKHKRTIDIIGEVTEEGKSKLREELDDVHIAFKDHIAFARPQLKDKIEEIGTGEHWLAVQAKELGLVDEILTSDEYLESVADDYEIIEILEKKPKPSFWKDWNETSTSVKSVAARVQSKVEEFESGHSMPMAIV
jgi:serine protease SohB